MYQDLKVCEAAAKEMANKLQTLAGCAPPSAATSAQPPASGEKGPATQQWEASEAAREAARAKRKADSEEIRRKVEERAKQETVTECQRGPGGALRCTTRPRW